MVSSSSLTSTGERFSKPKLWKKFRTPGFGAGRNVRFGDLDSDGHNEVVLVREFKLQILEGSSGHLRRVVMFPDDGHPDLAAYVADVTGDRIDEIILWNQEEV